MMIGGADKKRKRSARGAGEYAGSTKYYKRGATISSTDVADALKKRQQAKVEVTKELRKNKLSQQHTQIIRIAVLIIVGGWFLSRQFIVGASVVIPDDVIDPQYEQLERIANEQIASQTLSKFKPLFDEGTLEGYLKQEMPLLGSVSVSAPLFSRNIRIEPSFRSPVFVWEDTRHSKVYLIDKEGVVVAEAGTVTTDNFIRIIDNSGVEAEVGKPILPAAVSEFLVELTNRIKSDTSLNILRIEPTDSTKVYHVYVKASPKPYFIKVSTLRTAEQHVNDLKPVLKLLNDKNIQPSLYIDLRINDRAFFK